MSVNKFMQRHPVLVLIVCAALLLIPGIAKDFSTRGEPREALIVQSIILSGDWILPSGYSGVVPSKPPLMHWIAAVFSLPFAEVTPASVRLPSALFALGFCVYFFCFLRTRVGSLRASLSVALLLSSFEWFRAATSCRVDMTFAACLCIGFCELFSWGERSYRGPPLFAIIALGAATLGKGPVALVLAGIVFSVFSIVRGESILKMLARGSFVFLPALTIGLAWYGIAYLKRPEEFLAKVWYENVARFLSTQEDEPHKKNALYLYAMLGLGMLPWVIVLVPQIPRIFQALRSSSFAACVKWFRSMDAFSQFSAIIILVIILFFSIPSSKRGVYLLPIYPFVFYQISSFFQECWDRRSKIIVRVGVAYAVLLVLANGVILPIVSSKFSSGKFAHDIKDLVQGQKLYSYNTEFYGLSFDLKKPMWRFEALHPTEGLVVLNREDLEKFQTEVSEIAQVEVRAYSGYGITKPGNEVALVSLRAKDLK